MSLPLRSYCSLTLPVMMGYLPLGAVFGVLWMNAGLEWYWAPVMSLLVYAGALQYLAVGMLTLHTGWLEILVATLLVNFRHIFYGLSLYHLLPAKVSARLYFIFGITDETYSLLTASGQVHGHRQALLVVALNHSYWILGTLAGLLLASGLPAGLNGLDFALTALFTVLAVEQVRARRDYAALALGLGCAMAFAFGLPQYFLLAASLALVMILLAWPGRSMPPSGGADA